MHHAVVTGLQPTFALTSVDCVRAAHFSSGGASPCGGQRRIQLTLPCYSSPGSAVKDTLRGSSPCCGMAPFCDVASSCPWRCLGIFSVLLWMCVPLSREMRTHICEMFSCVDVVTVVAFRYALRRARRTAVTHMAMGMLLQCASFIEIVVCLCCCPSATNPCIIISSTQTLRTASVCLL